MALKGTYTQAKFYFANNFFRNLNPLPHVDFENEWAFKTLNIIPPYFGNVLTLDNWALEAV